MRGVGRGWGMWEKETEGCGKKLEGVRERDAPGSPVLAVAPAAGVPPITPSP